ncbi:MAG: nitrous oxide reductase family maturation protein NosD [Phycisphaerae bacterium]
MNKKHFYAAVILLLLLVVGTQTARATIYLSYSGWDDGAGNDPEVGDWDPLTKTGTLTQGVYETIQIMDNGITLDGADHTATGSGSGTGISLAKRRYVTVKNLTVEGFLIGISLDNWHPSDPDEHNGYNTIENNTFSSVATGINIGSSHWNTVTNNTVSTCHYGIHLAGSRNNTVTYNTVNSSSEYGIYLGQGMQGPVWVGSNENTLTNNTVTGVSTTGGIGIYIDLCLDNTLSSNTVSNCKDGINLSHSYSNIDYGNTLTTNNISNNYWGIHLYCSTYNSLTGNNVTDNAGGIWLDTSCIENNLTNNTVLRNGPGIYLRISSNSNTVTGNTASDNDTGIILSDSSDNTVYNNKFIDNTTQATVTGGSGNVFDLNGSGNYWSDYTGVDDGSPYPGTIRVAGDGIGDTLLPHAGVDIYPLMPTPEQAIEELIDKVEVINGNYGISNALDAKLENALAALEAKNAGQRQDAINKMQAFINAVEAQSGDKIPVEKADELIADANYIISLL